MSVSISPSHLTAGKQPTAPPVTFSRIALVDRPAYRLETTPLSRQASRPRSCIRRVLGQRLYTKMKSVASKLLPKKPDHPTPLKEYTTAVPLAVAPVVGDTSSELCVILHSITPGRWQGKPASLLLFEFTHHDKPVIPSVKLALRVIAADKKADHSPVVVAVGPGKVKPEQQDLEQTRAAKADAEAIGGAPLAHGRVGGGVERRSTQHDTVHASFSTSGPNGRGLGYDGVEYNISAPPQSKRGVPTELKLAVICQFDGVAVIRADIKAGDTWRKLTLRRGDRLAVSFDHGDYMEKQALDCQGCESAVDCRDFSHLNEEFWYTLLHQPTFRERVPVEFIQRDSDVSTTLTSDAPH